MIVNIANPQWHETLEEASRLHFGEGDTHGMLSLLLPKHELLARGPCTLREASFAQYFGNELHTAWESLKSYMALMKVNPFLMIYICNFHVLSNLLLIYMCKLHWNLRPPANRSAAVSRARAREAFPRRTTSP